MQATKTLKQREKELQALLVNTAGRQQLEQLANQYHAANGSLRPLRNSFVTYIIVHERERGLIVG